MTKRLFIALAAVIISGGVALVPAKVSAQPTYCVREAWHYADRKAGPDRTSEAWSYYNALFQDYNDCYGPNECNDVTIACVPPE